MENDIIADFRNYLLYELNRSLHTVEAYCRDVLEFIQWLPAEGSKFNATDVSTTDIRTWLGEIAEHRSSTTVRRKTQSLRAFYSWMMRKGFTMTNPAADIRLAKIPKHLPEFVKENEIEKVICDTEEGQTPGREQAGSLLNQFRRKRAHIILLTLYSTGIRREELHGLRDSDINSYSSEMRVTGKRSKQRIIPIPSDFMKELEEWKKIRNSRIPGLPIDPPLFPNRRGKPLSRATINNIVKDTLSSTSASKKSPHVLRHTFATLMLNGGSDLNSVKEFLGHSSLSTTQIYTHLSYSELKRNYDGAHPRATASD